jgi:eukaryotic-like serine/threonine-protein kinase
MKRCPECRRDYYDDTLLYCLDDGNALLEGPASGKSEPPASAGGQFDDEPQTAILSEPGAVATGIGDGERARAQIHTTEQTTVLQRGAEAEPRESLGGISEEQSFSANRAAKPLAVLVVAVLVLVGGFFGYRYFSTASSKQINSIAVMPFVNASGNPDIEYLSDGMTETLINSLSQIPNLNVKARSSVFRYKGKEVDPKKIASELNVEAILNGRVIQRGDQLTLNVELIDASTENTIWGSRYERSISQLVALQSEVARDVSSQLKSKLKGSDAAKVEKSYTASTEAYQLYLKGRFQWNKRTTDSLRQAADLYRQAIETDPGYALAYSGLAETYVLFPIYSVAAPRDSMPLAKAAAQKALEIDDSLARAHAALGSYLTYNEFDRVGAEREYRRAIELDPNYATAHHWLGNNVLIPTKRFDEGIQALKRAEELDPLSPIIGANLGDAFVYAGRFDQAFEKYRRVLSLDPNFTFGHFTFGWAYYSKKMYPEAITELRKALEMNYQPESKGLLAAALARSGRRSEALALLSELEREATTTYVPNVVLAYVYIGLGQTKEALDLLEKDVDERSSMTAYYAIDPVYDDLRSEPRFKAMLKRLNLPE